MAKKMTVDGTEIAVVQFEEKDYISLTDMVRNIENEAGLNRFVLSVKQWTEKTNSRGIIAKAGRYGGTYAHETIAFEFASWVSPQFKGLYLPRLQNWLFLRKGWTVST